LGERYKKQYLKTKELYTNKLMSDYRVRINIRNNRLLKAMEARGFTSASKFEKSYGLQNYSMINLVNGSYAPLDKKGEIKPFVKEILEILNISLEDAFTEKQLKGFKKNSFTIEAKESQLTQIAEMKKPLEISLIEKDVKTLIDTYVYSLPEKHRKIVKAIIYENRTLKDLAKELNVSRERVRQLFKNAIRKLRTSENFEKLIESGARDLFENTIFSRFPENKISLRDDFEIVKGEINDNDRTVM
jgi:RNA polymerase sigma factor (sigma-70 family)